MDRLRRHWLAGVVAVALLVVAVWTVSRVTTEPGRVAQSIVMGSGPWSPYVGADLPDDGPVARIAVEALRRAGYDPQVSFSSWAVARDRTDQREVVASFPWIATTDRRAAYVVSDSILTFDYVLFAAASTDLPADLEALATMRIGLIDGYAAWDELSGVADFVAVPSAEQGFRCLLRGVTGQGEVAPGDAESAEGDDCNGEPIDLLVEGRLSGRAVVAANPAWDADDVRVVEVADDDPLSAYVGSQETLHLLAPQTEQGRELVMAFDEGLAAVRTTELYRQALTQLEAGAGDRATLVADTGMDVAVLWADADGDEGVATPVGTAVTVIEWPDAFTQTGPVGTGAGARVRVKVDSGPSTGQVVWVDPAILRLVAPS